LERIEFAPETVREKSVLHVPVDAEPKMR